MNTTPADLEVTTTTAKGNTYKVVVYVDPAPGKVGSERVRETCYRCSGKGTVDWGNVTFHAQGVEDRHCFTCLGKGYTTVLVSSLRSTARRQAKAQTLRNAEAADFAAEAPAREAAQLEADHEAALREEARRNAMPKGFLGEVGVRVRNLRAQVRTIRYYDSQNYVTGAPEQKAVLTFLVEGRIGVWFTDWSKGLEEGQTVVLTGTVKELTNYKGTDQTVLTRCTVKEA